MFLDDLDEAKRNRDRIAATRGKEVVARGRQWWGSNLGVDVADLTSGSGSSGSCSDGDNTINQDITSKKLITVTAGRRREGRTRTGKTRISRTGKRIGRPPGMRIGHYPKVATKVGDVVRLYNSGFSTRLIANELDMSTHTVRMIIDENSLSIDFDKAALLRKKMVRARRSRR